MRNLHLHVHQKFGKEYIILLLEWEDLVKKMADFGNHQRFTLRSLKTGINPISYKLKKTVRTPRSYEIFKKAENKAT